jgi:hypothetical protein
MFWTIHTMSQKFQAIGNLVIWQNAGNYKKGKVVSNLKMSKFYLGRSVRAMFPRWHDDGSWIYFEDRWTWERKSYWHVVSKIYGNDQISRRKAALEGPSNSYQLLVYADDVNLLGDNTDNIKKVTETLTESSREVNLEVNVEKTKKKSKIPVILIDLGCLRTGCWEEYLTKEGRSDRRLEIKWVDNIEFDLREIWWGDMEWIHPGSG